ncbi:hypothetical protein BD769DRAFT_1391362 [Suillus cothurnatus]|nr:hypothetical protein BD769DRAFT_1391362 [Suillus cothurnatus]
MIYQSNPTSNGVPRANAPLDIMFLAEGGGDEPDSQSHALSAAYNADQRAEARKIVVLITDPTPHEIGEDGDEFPEGCPLETDPRRVAMSMERAGITLYVVACEPTLSENSKRARAFYQGLVKKTRLHKNSVAADTHVDTWFNAENLNEVENQIQQVEGNHVLGNYQPWGRTIGCCIGAADQVMCVCMSLEGSSQNNKSSLAISTRPGGS